MNNQTISLAMTGASGAPYGLRLLEVLLRSQRSVYLMISSPGRMCIEQETDLKLPARPKEIQSILEQHFGLATGRLQVFGKEDWFAPVASGSNPADAMVVCPCTSGTLATIASGQSRSLVKRAADVTMKEGRKLILVVREMPFSVIHLENMLKLARTGVVIMPANPGFYQRPSGVSELVDFVVARVLDHLNVEHQLLSRWGADD